MPSKATTPDVITPDALAAMERQIADVKAARLQAASEYLAGPEAQAFLAGLKAVTDTIVVVGPGPAQQASNQLSSLAQAVTQTGQVLAQWATELRAVGAAANPAS